MQSAKQQRPFPRYSHCCQPIPSSIQTAGPTSGMHMDLYLSSFAPKPHLHKQELCYLSSRQRKKQYLVSESADKEGFIFPLVIL